MRRFQFSLLTLLIIVAILAAPCWYVGEQWRIVRERQQFLQAHPGALTDIARSDPPPFRPIPWIRKLLGDGSRRSILVSRFDFQSDEELESIQDLFPEAEIWVMPKRIFSGYPEKYLSKRTPTR